MFSGPIPAGKCILHNCDNRACVNPDHLRVGTAQENTDDMVAKGRRRIAHGEQMSQAKLSDAVVAEMRRMRDGGCRVKDIAEQFGINTGNCSRITRGLSWKHVIVGDNR
jgi:hypothetical protein